MLDRRDRNLHDERIAAGPAMTFEHLLRLFRHLDNVTVVDPGDAHSHERGYRQTDLRSVDLGTISGYDTSVLELANPLDHGRSCQTDPPAQLCIADTRILL